MTPQMILDKMDQMIRLGFVNARMPEKMRVKVTLPDLVGGPFVTDWLPVLCPRASGDMQYDLPDIGDQVLCLFLSYGLEQGFVIGSMYGKQVPPVQNADKWHRTFRDGTTLEYDRATHPLTADIRGGATIRSTGPLTLEAPIIYLRGTLVNTATDGSPGNAVISGGVQVLSGGISVPEGDVMASGVSLVSHTTEGVMPGDGVSGVPTGGGPGAISADADRSLAALAENIEKSGSPTDKLILCLPDIARAMASATGDDLQKYAWELLEVLLKKWLSGAANPDPKANMSPHFLDWNDLIKYGVVQDALQKMKSGLITDKFKDKFTKKLQEKGHLTDHEEHFDFIEYHVPGWDGYENWQNWENNYSQYKEICLLEYAKRAKEMESLYVALGCFTLCAMVKGYVKPKVPSGHQVCITEIAVFIADRFNFAGASPLGSWDCENLEFTGLDSSEATPLGNFEFREFRDKWGHGNDFRIFSQPVLVEDFEKCCYDTSL